MSLLLWLSLGLSLVLAVSAGLLILLAYVGSASLAAGVADWKAVKSPPALRRRGWEDAHVSNFAPSGFAGH